MTKPKNMIRWIFYCPQMLLDRVDVWAKASGITHRADAVRQLLRAALDAADARSPLSADDLAELEALRVQFDAKTPGDAIRAARRTAAALEAQVDDGARPTLTLVPPPPPPQAPAPSLSKLFGFLG